MHSSTLVRMIEKGTISSTTDLLCVMGPTTDPVVLFQAILKDYNGEEVGRDDVLQAVFKYILVNHEDKVQEVLEGVEDLNVIDGLKWSVENASDFIAEKGSKILTSKVDNDIKPTIVRRFNADGKVFVVNLQQGTFSAIVKELNHIESAKRDESIRLNYKRYLSHMSHTIRNIRISDTVWYINDDKLSTYINHVYTLTVTKSQLKKYLKKRMTATEREWIDKVGGCKVDLELLMTPINGNKEVETTFRVEDYRYSPLTPAPGSNRWQFYDMPESAKNIVVAAAKAFVMDKAKEYKLDKVVTKLCDVSQDPELKVLLG